MAESNRDDESRALTADFVERIDKLTKSPSERASFIWSALAQSTSKKITNWDLICFCVETLGFISVEFPWLREAAIMVNKLVYKAHYLNHDRIIDSDHEIDLKKGMNIPRMSGE